ncbi:MAG TPA: hypothetical protein VFC19_39900 [Candidatus Limnocylindrales bacterium]|nr:hypothetical protein [Candidatus Limnocylindrales bacterium]
MQVQLDYWAAVRHAEVLAPIVEEPVAQVRGPCRGVGADRRGAGRAGARATPSGTWPPTPPTRPVPG